MKRVICCVALLAVLGCAKLSVRYEEPPGWQRLVFEFQKFWKEGFPHSKEWGRLEARFLKLARRGYVPIYPFLFPLAERADAGFGEDLGCLFAEMEAGRPELFKKLLQQQPKKIQQDVQFLQAVCGGEPGD